MPIASGTPIPSAGSVPYTAASPPWPDPPPPKPSDVGAALTYLATWLTTTTVGGIVALYNNQPYAFGAATQYPTVLVNNGVFVPAMDDDPTLTFLQSVPSRARKLSFFETRIAAELLAGEDFDVELIGCVYDPNSNTLLQDTPLSPFDTPIVMSFVAGDKATQRQIAQQSLLIGGQQATHISYRWLQGSTNIYQALISVLLGFTV